MKPRPIALALLIALAPATLSTASRAQPAADDATTTMARARFKEGVKYFDKGDFEAARAAFLQAYALKKHPAILLNLGWSCLKSGHALEAYKYFKQFLADGGSDISDKQRSDASDGLKQSRTSLGQIDVVAATGATITVDGENQGATPLAEPVVVDLGAHLVIARWPDGTSDSQSVTTMAGERVAARFSHGPPVASTPAPEPVPRPAPPYVAPPPPPPAAAAPSPASTPPAATEAVPNNPQEEPESKGSKWSTAPVWIGAGVTLAAVGVGVWALVAKSSAQNSASDEATQIENFKLADGERGSCPYSSKATTMEAATLAPACNTYNSDINYVNQDATVGNIAIAVGAVALVGTIVYGIAELGHNNSVSQLVLAPTVGRSEGGLSISGSF